MSGEAVRSAVNMLVQPQHRSCLSMLVQESSCCKCHSADIPAASWWARERVANCMKSISPQNVHGGGVLHLAQHVGHLVLQQRGARSEGEPKGRDGAIAAGVAQRKHGRVARRQRRGLIQQRRLQLLPATGSNLPLDRLQRGVHGRGMKRKVRVS